ncbi:ABC-2 transporter permease [Roseburia hominis]|uniref:ABC-2 transporter permease n=1 Tax=Roseburia hominis TaxID=301301 RepID=UPI001F1FE5F0|nr:ABC-2 transporter permease [Roseburia hominis]
MRGLLLMDFKFLKRQTKFLVIVGLLVFVFLFNKDMSSFGVAYATMLFGIFAVNSIYYDEANNGNAFLFTLPFSRKEYVFSKYLFGMIIGGGAWILSNLIGIGYLSMANTGINIAEWFAINVVYLILLLVMLSFMFPIQFKFGMEKSRLVMLILVVLVFMLMNALTGGDHMDQLNEGMAFLERINPVVLFGGALVAVLAFTGVSVVLSMRIVEKKQM